MLARKSFAEALRKNLCWRSSAPLLWHSIHMGRRRPFAAGTENEGRSPNLVVKAGLPFILFSVLASWVVSNALDGKLKEQEVSQGKASISLRQAKLKEEHDEMMERLNKLVQADFDNTKRIKRPHEILEERRLERERRNKWYRRWWRAIKGRLGGSEGTSD